MSLRDVLLFYLFPFLFSFDISLQGNKKSLWKEKKTTLFYVFLFWGSAPFTLSTREICHPNVNPEDG